MRKIIIAVAVLGFAAWFLGHETVRVAKTANDRSAVMLAGLEQ